MTKPELEALSACMLALTRIEWAGRDRAGGRCCPSCGAPTLKAVSHRDGVHKPKCELNTARRQALALIGEETRKNIEILSRADGK